MDGSRHFCPNLEFLLPIVVYLDKTGTAINQRYPLEPLLVSIMNVGDRNLNAQQVEAAVQQLEHLRENDVQEINDNLTITALEREEKEIAEDNLNPPQWYYNTFPEHLLEAGHAMDILGDIISVKQQKLQFPNDAPSALIDSFPRLHLDNDDVDTYRTAQSLSMSIPNADRPPQSVATRDLFPVSFSLTIPHGVSPDLIPLMCRSFEKFATLYHRYLLAYEWTFSETQIAAARAGNEFPYELLDAECLVVYRIGIKKRIGELLLDLDKRDFWLPPFEPMAVPRHEYRIL